MGIFDDKQYDEMDWLSKAIEPTISSLNDALSKLPEETDFSPPQIMRLAKTGYNLGVDLDSVVLTLCQKHGVGLTSWDDDFKKIVRCFDMELIGPDITLDLENNICEGGTLRLTKIKSMFEENELQKEMGSKGISNMRRMDFNKVEIARANEIGELLGNDIIRQKRSSRQKVQVILEVLAKGFAENTWNIKNVELSDKVCLWIQTYLETGNLAALTNFCKFKVMTHAGDPIYSMEEEAL